EPRVTRAGGASHDRLNQVERHEPKQETGRRRRPAQHTFVPEGLAGDVRQVPEVRDDVGRVREEQQPEEAESQQLDSPRAAPVAVVDEQRKPEGDPGEEKVPEKRHVLDRMRVCDTESDEPGNQGGEPNKRAKDNQTAVAERGAEPLDHTSRLARRLGTRTDHLRVTEPPRPSRKMWGSKEEVHVNLRKRMRERRQRKAHRRYLLERARQEA